MFSILIVINSYTQHVYTQLTVYRLAVTRSFKYSRAKCYEELLQVEFGILREGNLNPHRRLEVVHVNVERG